MADLIFVMIDDLLVRLNQIMYIRAAAYPGACFINFVNGEEIKVEKSIEEVTKIIRKVMNN